jgi:hypothetical protein
MRLPRVLVRVSDSGALDLVDDRSTTRRLDGGAGEHR